MDGVRAALSSGAVRGALEALPVPADDPVAYGLIVSHQAMGWNRHPLNRPRAELTPADGVEPVGFRELDSRRQDDAVVLEDRVLGVCASSGVAVRLRDADEVRLFHAPGRGGAVAKGLRPPAQVVHPIPERFAGTEDGGAPCCGPWRSPSRLTRGCTTMPGWTRFSVGGRRSALGCPSRAPVRCPSGTGWTTTMS